MPKDSFWRRLSSKAVILLGVTVMVGLSFWEGRDRFQVGPSPSVTPVPWEQETPALNRYGAAAGPYGAMGRSQGDRAVTDPMAYHQEAMPSSSAAERWPLEGDEVIRREAAPLNEAVDGAADLMEKSKRYHLIVIRAALRHEVDPDLVKAVIMAESGYDPKAVSREGASGLMQLMPDTAEALGVEDVFNAEHNVNGGVRYLKQLLVEFNHDIELALAAYCVGSGTIRRHQGLPPKEDIRSYLKKIFAYYRILKNEGDRHADGA